MSTNKNKKVFHLILFCFIIYFATSLFSLIFKMEWKTFQRVNLLSEIFKKPKSVLPKTGEFSPPVQKYEQNFDLYKKGELITNFYNEDSCALPLLAEKLNALQKGKKIKIRIAYFGDSMIEGDLLTQELRRLLQEKFGGNGVGYLPLSSPVAGFRQTAYCTSNGFTDNNFKTKSSHDLYISGHVFSGAGSGSYSDKTLKIPNSIVQKYIIYNNGGNINFNGQEVELFGKDFFNKKILATDNSSIIKLKTENVNSKIFGVGFESETGIILDNFSFRGITGVELRKINDSLLAQINKENPYDLIVFQYGVNMLFRPNDTNYDYYQKIFDPVLKKYKSAFPDSEFLIVSTADRAFQYDGEYKTASGMPNLIATQAKLAYENKMAFYNQFQSMGGENSIVAWAQQSPPLAGKDYVHPNGKGTDILAKKIFAAMVSDTKKLDLKKKIK